MLNTKLCFYWYPDGDGGQCAASDRTLCAVANQWTAYYRDDTDNRPGGCQMSWGLKIE
ncbi:perivitellin-2 67 kDa subunit-like protein, partial [Dinothrombium tinctorium]